MKMIDMIFMILTIICSFHVYGQTTSELIDVLKKQESVEHCLSNADCGESE